MIYLNNAAGTKPFPEVVAAIVDVLENNWANPHDTSSVGHDAQMAISNVTDQVAEDINCSPDEIIWTSGAAEANSLAIMGLLHMHPHMHFYTTKLEHTSISNVVKSIPGNPTFCLKNDNEGFVDLKDLENKLRNNHQNGIKTLVSVGYANSEIGTIQDIKAIAEVVHKYDGVLHTDATQAYPWCENLDVDKLGIDMMSVSGQKLNGPKGVGFLYVKNGIELKPLIYGSQQQGRRGGTMPTHLIVGFGVALEITRRKKPYYKAMLRDKLLERLMMIDEVRLNGPTSDRLPNNISLTIDGVNAEKLTTLCDVVGEVIIGKGSACKSHEAKASDVLLAIGLTEEQALNTVRITLGESNVLFDIEQAAKIITGLVERIRHEED